MERFVSFEAGEFYHIYNRGVDKQAIFKSPYDYSHFQKLLYIRNAKNRIDVERIKNKPLSEIDRGETLIDILAYALMPNHFHLLVKEKQVGGVSKFMNKFATSYAMYFNNKYERTGPLMCRPFRCKHIDSDEYLRWVLSYIHLNPLKVHNKNLQDYMFSSYCDYYTKPREETAILNIDQLPFDKYELEKINTMRQILKSRD